MCFSMDGASSVIRPPLNKKLFPVHRPGGLKKNFIFFTPPPPPYNLVLKKKKSGKMKKKSRPPDWPFFGPPGPQETII